MDTLTISYKTAMFLGNIDESTDSDLKIKLKTIQTIYHVVLHIRTKAVIRLSVLWRDSLLRFGNEEVVTKLALLWYRKFKEMGENLLFGSQGKSREKMFPRLYGELCECILMNMQNRKKPPKEPYPLKTAIT